jgi:hypothetical protein
LALMTASVPRWFVSDDCVLHFLLDPCFLTRRRDMGQLHDRMAQDLVLHNFSPATRWRALREAVILCR